ncbi:MAG: glycine C-acetyltransferase [Candidatus Dormibacteraeota bacterium]|nr:glycine C-acetyltransferase [Candidatus Dormibacteraeota bacterium]
MITSMRSDLAAELESIRAAGLEKRERIIAGPQGSKLSLRAGQSVLNLCANNYLGLADHPAVIEAAKQALDRWGFGTASVRFICGTQQIHKELEDRLSALLGSEDTILYSSCFDANGGIFEALLDERDAVISDALNHASIIDGIRLSKARRLRYANRDMADLEQQLRAASDARYRLIVTDGVFSMDGYLAPLPDICDLAERHDALVMVDDSHAVGFMGEHGGGTPEHHGVVGRVDILTGTLGKALGGASGGYVSGRGEIVALLRQRSRPYLFSNSVAPVVVGASLAVLDLLASVAELRRRLRDNTAAFRAAMVGQGFEVLPGQHPIVPIMIGEAGPAAALAEALLTRGIYVVAFSYPVVPRGQARIRTQVSAAHTEEELSWAAGQFAEAARELGLLA